MGRIVGRVDEDVDIRSVLRDSGVNLCDARGGHDEEVSDDVTGLIRPAVDNEPESVDLWAGVGRDDGDLAADARKFAEMEGQRYADQWNVWTSTESTAGRSRTIAVHESPASADAYTWPPVVPK